MWNGKVTEELKELFQQYGQELGEGDPDEYEEICYDSMTYEEFIGYIKEALRRRWAFPDVVIDVSESKWGGELTGPLLELIPQYILEWFVSPGSYEQIDYSNMDSETYAAHIKCALERKCEFPDVVDASDCDKD